MGAALHLPRLPLRRGDRLARASRRSTRSKAASSRPTRRATAASPPPTRSVDRIQQNILWGQWSNFLAVPTDASQRDERLGWTGDIQAFASTGAFNGDYATYLEQWLQTLRDSQCGRRRLPRRRAADLLRRGHGRLGRRRHGRAVGALPALRRRARAGRQLRRDGALGRLPARPLERPDPPQRRLRRLAGDRRHADGPDRRRPSSPTRSTSSAEPRLCSARTTTPRSSARSHDQIAEAPSPAAGCVPTAASAPAARPRTCCALHFGLVPDGDARGRGREAGRQRRGA